MKTLAEVYSEAIVDGMNGKWNKIQALSKEHQRLEAENDDLYSKLADVEDLLQNLKRFLSDYEFSGAL